MKLEMAAKCRYWLLAFQVRGALRILEWFVAMDEWPSACAAEVFASPCAENAPLNFKSPVVSALCKAAKATWDWPCDLDAATAILVLDEVVDMRSLT